MGMTMTQKILAAHAGLDSVEAGQLITAKLDLVLANDITGPVSINEFEKAGFGKVFDKSKIALVMDHFVPNKDIKSAEQCKKCRTFARRFDIDNFYDVGSVISSSISGFNWYDGSGNQTVDPGITITVGDYSNDEYTVTISAK